MFNLESLCGVEMTEDLRLYRTEDMRYKGIICDQQNQLVVQNFAVPTELILPRDHEAVYESFRDETFPLTVYESIEGTILRVYWFGDEWRVSTTSRIDAFGSSWASEQSFGDQLKETIWKIAGIPLEVFFCSLRPDRKYFFLLPTVGINRLGKTPDTESPKLFLVAIENQEHALLYGADLPRDETNLWSFVPEHVVNTLEELLELGSRQNLLYYRSASEIVKLHTEPYAKRCALRNNEMNLFYRYLELYANREWERCEELSTHYPEVDFRALVKEPLERLAYYLHQVYLARYVHKEQQEQLPYLLYAVLRKCHSTFLETREKTTRKKVLETLLSQHPRNLLKMIRLQETIN